MKLAISLVLLALGFVYPARAQAPLKLLDIGTGAGTTPAPVSDSPTGGSGSGSASGPAFSTPRPACSRFIQLVQSGELGLSAWIARRKLVHTDRDLQSGLACFTQALALRARERILRAEVGSWLYQPDLDLAVLHFYLGNHGAALANLDLPLSQRVPAGADYATADRIRGQLAKARDLHARLTSPFLAAYAIQAQRTMSTCAPTSVYMRLTGLGLTVSLSDLEARREQHSGGLPDVAHDARLVAGAAGCELDAAWTENPHPGDPEVALGGSDLESIRDVLSRGQPVILTPKAYEKPEAPGWTAWTPGHFVLAVGARSDAKGRVTHLYVLDPDGGVYRRFERSEWESTWDRNGRGALVLVPRDAGRRFVGRLSVSSMFDSDATMRRWVGAGGV